MNGNILRDAIISGANNITNNRQAVDELNVFPVPDGDTGTNMSMTINNAVRELVNCENKKQGRYDGYILLSLKKGERVSLIYKK